MNDKYVCIVVKNGRVENSQIGDESYVFQHLENVAKQYIGEDGVTQIVVTKQDHKGKIEIMYEWVKE